MSILFFILAERFVRFMTYPAPSINVPSPPPEPFKEIKISYDTNESVCSWLFENEIEPDTPIVLIFHGNGENLETMQIGGLLNPFMNLNINFLAMDYPGYGWSDGKPSEKNNIAAANATFHWIEANFKKNPKIIFGWSLGAAVAIQTVYHNREKVDGLIAISCWSSLRDVAAAHYPRFLVNSLLKENYNSVEAVKKIECPVLLIHGEKDNIIPISQGKKVAKAMNSSAQWIPVSNSGHNDIFSREVVWKEIAGFINFISNK